MDYAAPATANYGSAKTGLDKLKTSPSLPRNENYEEPTGIYHDSRRRIVQGGLSAADRDEYRHGPFPWKAEVPINRLPDELLLHICSCFLSASQQHKYTDPNTRLQTYRYSAKPPFVLSWVSSRWRTLVLNAPSIWQYIHLSKEASHQLLRLQVDRSKSHSLSIYAEVEDRTCQFMQYLTNTADRWHTLIIVFFTNERFDGWTNDFHNRLCDIRCSRLKELSLSCYIPTLGTISVPLRILTLATNDPPKLSSLKLYTAPMDRNIHLFDTALTSLTLDCVRSLVEPANFRTALAACHSLAHLSISCSCIKTPIEDATDPIHMPSLRILEVAFHNFPHDDAKFASYFFRRLSAPRVEVLRMIDCSGSSLNAIAAALRQNAAFTANLTKLVFGHSGKHNEGEYPLADKCHPDAITVDFFARLPWIEVLELCPCWTSIVKLIRKADASSNLKALERGICCHICILSLRSTFHRRTYQGMTTVPLKLEDELRAFISGRKSGPLAIQKLCVEHLIFEYFTTPARSWLEENVTLEFLK